MTQQYIVDIILWIKFTKTNSSQMLPFTVLTHLVASKFRFPIWSLPYGALAFPCGFQAWKILYKNYLSEDEGEAPSLSFASSNINDERYPLNAYYRINSTKWFFFNATVLHNELRFFFFDFLFLSSLVSLNCTSFVSLNNIVVTIGLGDILNINF